MLLVQNNFLLIIFFILILIIIYILWECSVKKSLRCCIEEYEKEMLVLRYKAFYDHLTGLPNRSLFEDRSNMAIFQAKRAETSLAFIYFDLDKFKEINDDFGHVRGDELLRIIADRLNNSKREIDTVCRLGGDEFILLLPGVEGEEEVKKIAERIKELIERPLYFENQKINPSISMGIALYPHEGESVNSLIEKADKAMYKAKNRKKNC